MHVAAPWYREPAGSEENPETTVDAAESLDRERREFIREAAIRLHVCYRFNTNYQPESAWRRARELWDARPEDC